MRPKRMCFKQAESHSHDYPSSRIWGLLRGWVAAYSLCLQLGYLYLSDIQRLNALVELLLGLPLFAKAGSKQ